MKRILDDPDRVKRCSKCRKDKPVSEFPPNGDGYAKSRCRPCHRAVQRERYQRSQLEMAGDGSGAWGGRHLDFGSFVRICNCHGKVCRVWLVDDTIRCAVSARKLQRFRVSAA